MVELGSGNIPSHWELATLGEACRRGGGSIQTGPFGSQLHSSDYVTIGVPSVMPTNIGDNRIVEDGIVRITEKDADRLCQHRLRTGDIVYSRRGDVEKRALIREHEDGWFCGTGCLKVRLGKGVVDPAFASYQLGHPAIREWIVRHAVGATMPNLNTAIMEAIPFVLPPMDEQKRIAHILGTLDDKIELNRRMNNTLEEMAQALFKSWFIDFDPVVTKSEGRQPEGMDAATAKLFPSSFEDSVLGRIPKGWRVGKLGDLLDIKYGKDHKKLPDGKTPVYGSGGIMRYVTKAIYSAESVLIPRKGTLNNIMYLNKPFWTVDTMFYSIEKHPCIAKYIYLRMKRMNMELLDNGSVIPSMTTEILNNLPIIIPNMQILQQFDKVISFFFGQTEQNELESRTLVALRDTLLPRLLNEAIGLV